MQPPPSTFRLRALRLGIAVLLALPAGAALAQPHTRERLVMPYACSVMGGRVTLLPSREQAYRIYGEREERPFRVCSPINPNICRSWLLHRFDVDCGGERVDWLSIVEAASEATTNRAWVEDGRLHMGMNQYWARAESFDEDPCPRWRRRGRRADDCAERGFQRPRGVVRMPRGFAPAFGLPVRFEPVERLGPVDRSDIPPFATSRPRPQAGPEADVPFAQQRPGRSPFTDYDVAEPAPYGQEPTLPSQVDPPRDGWPDQRAESRPDSPWQPEPRPPQVAPFSQSLPAAPGEAPKEAPKSAARPLPPVQEAKKPAAPAEPAKAAAARPAVPEAKPATPEVAKQAAKTAKPKDAREHAEVAAAEPVRPAPAVPESNPGTSIVPKIINRPDAPGAGPRPEPPAPARAQLPQVTAQAADKAADKALAKPGTQAVEKTGDRPTATAAEPASAQPSAFSFLTSTTTLATAGLAALVGSALALFLLARRREQASLAAHRPRDFGSVPFDGRERRAPRRPPAPSLQAPAARVAPAQPPDPAPRHPPPPPYPLPTPLAEARLPASREEACRVLGASPDAGEPALRKIVEGLRQSWHPDLATGEADRRERERRMTEINVAWDILTGRRPAA